MNYFPKSRSRTYHRLHYPPWAIYSASTKSPKNLFWEYWCRSYGVHRYSFTSLSNPASPPLYTQKSYISRPYLRSQSIYHLYRRIIKSWTSTRKTISWKNDLYLLPKKHEKWNIKSHRSTMVPRLGIPWNHMDISPHLLPDNLESCW